jgi:hypothetical protein
MRLVLLDVRPSRVKEKKKIFLGKGLRVYKEIATDRKKVFSLHLFFSLLTFFPFSPFTHFHFSVQP